VGLGSGSQLGAYAHASGHVVLVVGHQQLVKDLNEGLRRAQEYSLPTEYLRVESLGHPGSVPAKLLIIHYEWAGRTDVSGVVGQASGGPCGELPAEVDLLSSGDGLFVHFGEPVEGPATWCRPLRRERRTTALIGRSIRRRR
jgi:hypothetical protein